MRCQEIFAALSDYIDGDLEGDVCAQVKAHLHRCPECRQVVDTLCETVTLYQRYGQAELPAGVRARLYAVLEREMEKSESYATFDPQRHQKQ